MAAPKYSACFNCSFTGDEKVGKTALAVTKATREFPSDYEPTVFENYAADVTVGSQTFLLGLFDNASQACYEPLRAFAYEKSDIFLLCYSVARRTSFQSLQTTWLPELEKYIKKKKPVLVIGLQTDLRTQEAAKDCVTTEEGKQLAIDIGAVDFFECSAYTKAGLSDVFDEVMRLMIASKKKRNTFAIFRSLRQQMLDLRSKTSKSVLRFLSPKSSAPKSSKSVPRTPGRKLRFSVG
ncbi:rho-related protein racD-like [Liolophura sinensis]|uniref:rho-related protein racD-like n=1 Tax=Liolophura sinensis TaxID=3198878 RepID=UPI0031586EEA